MYDFIRGTKEFQFDEAFVKNPSCPCRAYKKIRQALLLFVQGIKWPIVVFEVATECTEVKFTCTACDTCEMEKISKSKENVTSAYPGVITRRQHLP